MWIQIFLRCLMSSKDSSAPCYKIVWTKGKRQMPTVWCLYIHILLSNCHPYLFFLIAALQLFILNCHICLSFILGCNWCLVYQSKNGYGFQSHTLPSLLEPSCWIMWKGQKNEFGSILAPCILQEKCCFCI